MKVVVFFWIFIAAFPLVQGEVGSLKYLSYPVLLLHQAAKIFSEFNCHLPNSVFPQNAIVRTT